MWRDDGAGDGWPINTDSQTASFSGEGRKCSGGSLAIISGSLWSDHCAIETGTGFVSLLPGHLQNEVF